ncbi:hypothetical protein [Streptomyces sp. NPDC059649]|uniref:hypothetical protein n=1 Tax=Streptomyces sp. NPDC059649 TaxID=3346895 RepID=UPI0036B587B5
MSLFPSDAPSPAHPRFARALADLALAVPVRSFPEGTRSAADVAVVDVDVDVRERSS